MVIDARRRTNGRFRDAMAQLALLRLAYGKYRTVAELAVDMGCGEGTVRDWLTWWRKGFGVLIGRNSDRVHFVESWGALGSPGPLRQWMESGHAFHGVELDGRRYADGYVPWVEREWPEVKSPLMQPRPAFVPSGGPAPLMPSELPL